LLDKSQTYLPECGGLADRITVNAQPGKVVAGFIPASGMAWCLAMGYRGRA